MDHFLGVAKCGNANELVDESREAFSFIRKDGCHPWNRLPLVVSGTLMPVLENPKEALLFSWQPVPITASGLQGEQLLALE